MVPGTVLRMREPLPPLTEEEAASCGLATGDENPWQLVKVFGVRDFGADAGGIVPIVAPIAFSAWSSPVEISAQQLDELGYEVVYEAESDGGWTTPDAELAQPAKSAVPQYGQPGWAAAIRRRDEESKRNGKTDAEAISSRGATAKAKAEERKAALRAPKETA